MWTCKCGAFRRVTALRHNTEHIVAVLADPCKRCGNEDEPTGWPSDPWLGFQEAA